MLLLADENVQAELVEWLRSETHDVLYAAESRRQAPDPELLEIARRAGRAIVTDDLDFGELCIGSVWRRRVSSCFGSRGVPVSERIKRVAQVWRTVESNLPGHFIVITTDKIRVRALPPDPAGT